MEQMTVTAKIQISVDTDSKALLDKTMSVYSDACNYVSAYVFRTHDLKQFSLNKVFEQGFVLYAPRDVWA